MFTHSQKLERWLGGSAEDISRSMRGWYGPSVPLANVPGRVYVNGDGEFVGPIRGGQFGNIVDYGEAWMRGVMRRAARASARTVQTGGFATLTELIDAAKTGGKHQRIHFAKFASATNNSQPYSFWNIVTIPAQGGVGGTVGTGRVTTNATTGALAQVNAASGEQLHLIGMTVRQTSPSGTNGQQTSTIGCVMLYDRLWDMTYNHATGTTQAIDSANRPTRYQGSTSSIGNFIGGEYTTSGNSTSHTITITYVDDAGNTAEAGAAYTQAQASAVNRFWHPALWFYPLNSGDRGVRYLTQIDQSTNTSTTGTQNYWVGHPLGLFPFVSKNIQYPIVYDGINSAFLMTRVQDNACLAFFQMPNNSDQLGFHGFVELVSN